MKEEAGECAAMFTGNPAISVFPNTHHFYAYDNRPPTYLLKDLGGQEDAAVLVLGCGDMKDLFFTLACESW